MAAVLALVAIGVQACGAPEPLPQATVAAYLGAWTNQHWTAMAALTHAPPADFVAVHTQAWADLDVRSAQFSPGPVIQRGSTATVPLTSRLVLSPYGPLTLRSTLRLTEIAGRWQVLWTPRTIAAQLGPRDHFSVTSTWPTRAPVLGANGVSLTPATTLVTVGLVGQRIKDPTSLVQALVAAGLDQAEVATAITHTQAQPTQFVPIETISQATYEQIKAQIYALPGTTFETSTTPEPLTADLSAHIVGHTGPITAQQLKTLGPPYTATSIVGQNEIEQVYEKRLAGTPTVTVAVVNPAGTTVATLGKRPGVPAEPVQTTIEPRVQEAAEGALDGVPQEAAVVVMQASTGDVLAAVSRPTSQAFNVALDAAVPPGSTFKVVTTAALLQAGLGPDTAATCPPTITIDGKSFSNYEQETLPSLTLEQAFAVSCNTAFIGLSEAHLDAAQITQAAALFGLGRDPQLGLRAFGGSVPAPATAVDQAATSIGQGQVVVSPLALASVAAAVDSGTVHAARLVAGAADDTAASQPLDPTIDADLKAMMLQVVTSPDGTAAGAGLPASTYGKTGTAEFGSGTDPPEHAWFIGFQGDVAFAVFVYGGGVGGVVAAPIAAKLLNSLAGTG